MRLRAPPYDLQVHGAFCIQSLKTLRRFHLEPSYCLAAQAQDFNIIQSGTAETVTSEAASQITCACALAR